MSGVAIVAPDSITSFGVCSVSSPRVVLSFAVASEYEPCEAIESESRQKQALGFTSSFR